MKLLGLIREYFNKKEKKKREIGRFWTSDLYEILTDRLKPEDFFKEKKFGLTSCKNMFEGEIREMALKLLLDTAQIKYDYQVKKVKKFDDFEIVCVADFVFPDYILECKSPEEFSGLKEYHRPQLEAQFRIFDKPIYVGYFKERMEYQIYKYSPSDILWEKIIEKVSEFHTQVKKCGI